MKKEMFIIATIFALLLPFASADINLNPLAKSTYNKGDIIKVSGYVTALEDGDYDLSMFLICDTSQLQFLSNRIRNLKAGRDNLVSTEVTVPFTMSGDCQIQVNFGEEQVNSETFKVTKALRGVFTLVPLSIQLGDEIQLTGTITKLNNDQINGVGILYIEKEEQNFITANVQIVGSKFQYKTKVTSIPEGSYHINLAVNDLFGNEEFFWNAATLNVYEKFKVNLLLDKQQYNPGDVVKIQGDVQKTVGTKIESAEATIALDESDFTTNVVNNKFEFELPLSTSVKSNYHELEIIVRDDFGNFGEKVVKFYVIPKEIKLESGLEKELFVPKEIVTLKPKLYDQAVDLIDETLLLTVIDSKNKRVIEKQIPSNEDFNFKLNQFASPGIWTFKLKSKTLTQESKFTVDVVEDIDILLQGQFLKIKNIGNVPYTRDIEILATDSNQVSHTIRVNTGIEPNKEIIYPLYKDLESGTYDVYVDNKGIKFDGINVADNRDPAEKTIDFLKQATGAVTGTPGTSSNKKPLYIVLILLLTIILITFTMRFRTKARFEYERNRERRIGQQVREELKQKAPELRRQSYGKATKADVEDFQRRIAKDIQDHNIRKQSDVEIDSEGNVRHSIERNIIFDKYKNR